MAETLHPLHLVVGAPEKSRLFKLPEGTRLVESPEISPGVTFPAGFLASGVTAGLKQSGRPDAGAVAVAPEYRDGSTSAAVFTSNAFAAAPVIVTRDESDLNHLVALVVNSGNANACTGPNGLEVARVMQAAAAATLGLEAKSVGVASTGIIGVQLEKEFMDRASVQAAAAVHHAGGPDFARSIMTTDRYSKACAVEVELSSGTVRIGACAKGAGMICPAMATMICVVTTDASLSGPQASDFLRAAVDSSFNRATVDGEMSTNDTVFFLSSGASGVEVTDEDSEGFAAALQAVLLRLALMMVADGEGATKIMRVTVTGAESDEQAMCVCRAIADSPLVKTAMNGGDPNWGRILSSAGAAMAGRSLPDARLFLAGVKVVEQGWAAPLTPDQGRSLVAGVGGPDVDIELDLGLGQSRGEVFFADLGHEYITINAEYHT